MWRMDLAWKGLPAILERCILGEEESMSEGYRHVIWDWNGTLFDDTALCRGIVNTMLEQRGLTPLDSDQYRNVFGFPIQHYYTHIGFDFTQDPFERLSQEFTETYEARRHECSLHAEARSMIEGVASSGREQSLLSAYPHETLLELIHALELAPLFNHVVGLDNIHAHSKVEQGKYLVNQLSHATDEVLLVGDTIHDWEVAQEMGVACCLVAHGHQSKTRLQQLGVPVVDALSEILPLL
jgi:phosphoglycolate phosphatase